MFERFCQFIGEAIIAAVLAGITILIGHHFGHHWSFWAAFAVWFILCTGGWLIIITRDNSGGGGGGNSGDGNGFTRFLDALFSGDWF
jgi:hypothetical protein